MTTDRASDRPGDRTIGFFFGGIFLAIGLFPLLGESRAVSPVALGLGGTFVLVALVWPALLRPINHLWMGLGLVLQVLFSAAFLSLFYWLVFTPIAVVTRIGSKRMVDLRWKAEERESWWEVRTQPGPPPETVSKQY